MSSIINTSACRYFCGTSPAWPCWMASMNSLVNCSLERYTTRADFWWPAHVCADGLGDGSCPVRCRRRRRTGCRFSPETWLPRWPRRARTGCWSRRQSFKSIARIQTTGRAACAGGSRGRRALTHGHLGGRSLLWRRGVRSQSHPVLPAGSDKLDFPRRTEDLGGSVLHERQVVAFDEKLGIGFGTLSTMRMPSSSRCPRHETSARTVGADALADHLGDR